MAPQIIDIINFIPYNESIDLHNLLLDAIYIIELTLISATIPGTKICSDTRALSDQFVSCTVRIDSNNAYDDNDININVGNTTVSIPNDIITEITSDDVITDIIIVNTETKLNLTNNPAAATLSTPAPDDCQTPKVDNTLSITIKKENETVSEFSESENNIFFKVPCNGECDESFECIWLDKQNNQWRNDGCYTTIDSDAREILCECEHLTTFATLHNIHDICDNPFINEWLSSDEWDILLWIFFTIFLLIFLYAMFCIFYFDFEDKWDKHRYVVFLVGVTALFYAVCCLLGYFTKQSLLNGTRDVALIKLYTLFLLLPQITFFVIFSIVFYAWYCCIHTLYLPDVDMDEKQNRLKKRLIIFNIFICLFIFIYFILVLNVGYPSNNDIFVTGAMIWSIIITLTCLVFIAYCLLFKHLHYINRDLVPKTDAYVYRLLLIVIVLTIYFVFLCITNIYFTIDPSEHQTVAYTAVYYIIDILILIFLLLMYRDYLHKRIKRFDKSESLMANIVNDDYGKCEAFSPGDNEGHNEGNTTIEMNKVSTPISTKKKRNSLKRLSLDIFANSAPQPTVTERDSIKNKKSDVKRRSLLQHAQDVSLLSYDTKLLEILNNQSTFDKASENVTLNKTPTPHTLETVLNAVLNDNTSNEPAIVDYNNENDIDDVEPEQTPDTRDNNTPNTALTDSKSYTYSNTKSLPNKTSEKMSEKNQNDNDNNKVKRPTTVATTAKRVSLPKTKLKRVAGVTRDVHNKGIADEIKKKTAKLQFEKEKQIAIDGAKAKNNIENENENDTEEEEKKDEETLQDIDEIEESYDSKEEDNIENLLRMDLPQHVEKILGNRSEYKLSKSKRDKDTMERDLRKLLIVDQHENDKDNRKYSKLAVLKYYDILIETYIKYCKIGGDNDWLTIKGWDALYKDAFISDKKLVNICTEKECHALFSIIYAKHNQLKNTIGLKTRNKFMSTKTLTLSEWDDSDPWSGHWKQEDDNNDEIYKIKQLGDTKLCGFIKKFEFCDINGRLKNGLDKTKAQMIIFWHIGPRKNKRRLCKCSLIKPDTNSNGPIKMIVEWKEIPISSIVDKIKIEKGIYTMIKVEKSSNKDNDLFEFKIGLARHEYIDAMLVLAQMKYSNDNNMNKKYQQLTKLCENNLIPYIWGGSQGAADATIKSIFRPYSTELHRLFKKYSDLDKSDGADSKLLGNDEWDVLCQDTFKYANLAKDIKPSQNDVNSSFELAKEGYDLELTYKGFENALKNLAFKIYKNKPNAKYKINIKYQEKLKQLLKWCSKLEKSGYQPTISNN